MAANGTGKVHECDVVILGSGLAGSISGAILARQGKSVALIDAGTHPRFPVRVEAKSGMGRLTCSNSS